MRLKTGRIWPRFPTSRATIAQVRQTASRWRKAALGHFAQELGEEVAAKTAKNVSMRTAMARFPFVNPLESFDFAYQPSIDKRQV